MKSIKNELLVTKIFSRYKKEFSRDELEITPDYPFSVPVVRNFKKVIFKKPVTFLIGENGSGKSTLLEAFAECCGFNAEGGSRDFYFKPHAKHSDFCDYLEIEKSWDFSIADGYFVRAETLYNLATKVENLEKSWEIPDDYGEKSLHSQSHGESILSLLTNRITKRGLYLFDEPETGLSPKSLFSMLSIIDDLTKIKSQFIICTHSPILLAFPNAEIYEIKNDILESVQYENTDIYNLSKYFLMNYKEMLKKLEIKI
jgi:predicted ATPase